jgi:hypothetical protein
MEEFNVRVDGGASEEVGDRISAGLGFIYKHDRVPSRDQRVLPSQQTKRCTATARLYIRADRDVAVPNCILYPNTLNAHLKNSSYQTCLDAEKVER